MRGSNTLFSFLVLFLAVGCVESDVAEFSLDLKQMETPKGFPPIPYPEDNAYTYDRWILGKKLFHETRLSKDGKVSCASCHDHSIAFSDKKSFSLGSNYAIGTRNSPTLANIAYHPYFMREGGVPTLEMQVLVPIQEHVEFDNNIVLIVEDLSKDEEYNLLSQKAYSQDIGAYTITRALANYERSIISGTSPYDQFVNYGIEGALSEDQKKGMDLFFSERTNCSQCHSGFNFSNYQFENNGLYEEYKDLGRQRLTLKEEDKALFKVPTLRNIALTGPYMHDGSLANLEDVIAHYNLGGKMHFQKSEWIKPLNLTSTEKDELIAFLGSLTDNNFINNPIFEE